MIVCITGGAGYVGSHIAIELIQKNHEVIIVDNFVNSDPTVIDKIEKVTGHKVTFYKGDVANKSFLRVVFRDNVIDAVIHCAGLKSISASVIQPLTYYGNNINSTITLCEVMAETGVKKLIFSSSATVYGQPTHLPLTETSPVGIKITNPYGRTKYMIEQILCDFSIANPDWEVTILRYFNPIGNHESGLIGESLKSASDNLMSYILRAASGDYGNLLVFGDNYDTRDGTCIRDYVHVVDLAKGHIAALNYMRPGVNTYNLSASNNTTVLEIVHIFEATTGQSVPYVISRRRLGDVASVYADATKAATELHWRAEKTLEDACSDAWRWYTYSDNQTKGL